MRRTQLLSAGLRASVLVSLASVGRAAPQQPTLETDVASTIQMEDVTARSGIDFVTCSGADPSTQILEVKGGGVALIDFDADGDWDLFFPNGATLASPTTGPGARLYENLGGMQWRDVTAQSGIDHRAWSFGTAIGDYDGDGRDDIFVACFGQNRLWRNLGQGRFADATRSAGLAGETGWSTSAAFADLDGDSDLDLYVTRYVEYDPKKPVQPAHLRGLQVINGPRGISPLSDMLFENLGNGTFADRSESSGIRAPAASYGLNAAVLDLTGDGRADIFVANDSRPNFLLRNLGNMRFEDIGTRVGVATNIEGLEQASMGIAVGDVNGDGCADLLTTNFSDDTNTLMVSRADGFFDDATARFGVGSPSRTLCGWAAAFADLDHDADEDLFIVNGHVYPQATKATLNSEYAQPLLVMERVDTRFRSLAPTQPWLRAAHRDRSAVMADLDRDGDLDAVVVGLNQPVRILRNAHDTKDDWAVIALNDPASRGNRSGVGARIELLEGTNRQVRWIVGGGPFQSNAAQEAHFGLGSKAHAAPPQVRVTWPDGRISQQSVERGTRTVIAPPSQER